MASGQKLALRVKSKKSQNAILRDVNTQETVQSLLGKLSELTGVPEGNIALLKGFPPKRISYETSNLVESLGLQNQDTIIVECDTNGTPSRGGEGAVVGIAGGSSTKSTSDNDKGIIPSPEVEELSEFATVEVIDPPPIARNSPPFVDLVPSVGDDDSGLLLRQIVPSDNSCLFTSVTFCLSGGPSVQLSGDSSFLREMIANTVAADPGKFNEAILGRPNADYVKWIKKSESWGGGIELAILSEFYGMQISVVDTQSVHISNFGEDQNFAQRIFLIYDGIHYDPLYYEPFNGGSTRTIFEVSNKKMNDLAMQLAREAHASNQFTDLKNFSLRCQICNTLLKGQEEAQAHAKKTAHTAFAEIIKKK
ncbi:Ubiquitin thioesterase OTU1 [Orchesella cincta]|uniref:Ubiquitin thioesterase OTU n=1 Tax=Orchesella cincta TaxID=48709 RepID=A0A1D2NG05_ORCCI|nr:Ubiquitin thioesterase OTU1 [Orchesella cincta]